MKPWRALLVAMAVLALAACSSGPRKGGSAGGGGGYYKDDGPHANPPSDLHLVPDAVPRVEPLASGSNKPYVVLGRRYVPDVSGQPYRQRGVASWYGKKFHGNRTSNGEVYDMYAMTAAHKTLPLPSYVRVTNVSNGRSVVLRVNDRGPFHDGRIIDLSYVAAYKLDMLGHGSTEVVVERIMPDDIRNWQPAPDAPRMMADAGGTRADALPVAPPPAPQVVAPAAMPAPAAPSPAFGQVADASQPPVAPRQPVAVAQPAAPVQPPAPAQPAAPAPPAAAAAATSAAGAGSGDVFLQLGAFSQPANAQSLASRLGSQLADQGQPGVTVRQAANSLYRVLVGPYLTREAALGAAQTINAYTGIMPSISAP